MARVVAFVPDLLFGSKVQAALEGGGHDVVLTGDPAAVRASVSRADVLVVDLASDAHVGCDIIASLAASGDLGPARTLGFYSHVDVETRERAIAAGFDLVVPRSRMNREGAELVTALAGRGAPGSAGT